MRFQCPFCSYIIQESDDKLGKNHSCPSCKQNIIFPLTNREEGCVIGDFILNERLGSGSLATVFKATQISLRREVALKVLSQEYTDQKGVSDFLKEARAAAKLDHPNLVKAYAVGEENGTCFLAMDYIKGRTLKDIIALGEELPIDKALHIIQQVAEALYYAWEEAELIHRDVKPDNIMITDEGMVKLTDLGLAMNSSEWTEDMDISGSPSYMSPEQFSGEKLDTRSDIYSLGITLYQTLAKKLPYDGTTIRSIAKQHFHEEARPLIKIDTNIPVKAWVLVRKMISKKAKDRFIDMEDLLKMIWQLRQRTAPSTEMIPNVHTISIKRLEYDIQSEKIEQRRQEVERELLVEKKYRDKAKSSRILLSVASGVIVLLIAIGVIVLLSTGQAKKIDQEFNGKIIRFENYVADNATSLEELKELEIQGEKLISSAQYQGAKRIIEFKARVQLCLVNAENRLARQKASLMENKRKAPTALLTTPESIFKTEATSLWKDQVRTKVFELLKKHHFTQLEQLIIAKEKEESVLSDSNKQTWLSTLSSWVADLKRNYLKLTQNGIIKISPATAPQPLKADAYLLKGNIVAAAAANNANTELQEMMRAYYENRLSAIKANRFSRADYGKALKEVNSILSEIENARTLEPVYIELIKLKKVFSQ